MKTNKEVKAVRLKELDNYSSSDIGALVGVLSAEENGVYVEGHKETALIKDFTNIPDGGSYDSVSIAKAKEEGRLAAISIQKSVKINFTITEKDRNFIVLKVIQDLIVKADKKVSKYLLKEAKKSSIKEAKYKLKTTDEYNTEYTRARNNWILYKENTLYSQKGVSIPHIIGGNNLRVYKSLPGGILPSSKLYYSQSLEKSQFIGLPEGKIRLLQQTEPTSNDKITYLSSTIEEKELLFKVDESTEGLIVITVDFLLYTTNKDVELFLTTAE